MSVTGVSSYTNMYAQSTAYASSNTNNEVNQSKEEKSVLEQMQSKYSGFNITIGTFSKNQILSQGNGFQGVMISSAYLAKAESDEQTVKDLDEMLSGVETAYNWLKNALAQSGLEVVSCGYFIDDEGNMGSYSVVRKKDSMFDSLQKQSEDMERRAQESREKKAEEKKKAQRKTEEKRVKKAESEQEQQEKLKEKVENQCRRQFGGKFKSFTLIKEADRKLAAGKNAIAISAGVGVDMKI